MIPSPHSTCRGVRGATQVAADTEPAILSATAELFRALVGANEITPEDLAAIVFTMTPDLTSAFPAQAASMANFESTPRICAQEIDVPGSLPRCLRLLLIWNAPQDAAPTTHLYTNGAEVLSFPPSHLAELAQVLAGGPKPESDAAQ
ncbi:MAG: chorismate mutase [Planctomycetota bacterium]|nr:chorismate mutase [Planctomycetota bacterium]MDG2143170.1 chorismate mutase [Planctomycetota bacterium]